MKTKTLEHSGKRWIYHLCGNGIHTLILLPGSLGANQGSAKLLCESLSDIRILVPEYSPVQTMTECLEALDRIVNEERLQSAAVFGGSFGGLIAQCWARRTNLEVSHLILSGTATPDPSRVKSNRRVLRLLPWIPAFLIRGILRIALRRLLPASNAEWGRWSEEYKALIKDLTKQDLASRYVLAIDYDKNYQFKSDDLPGRIPVLLLYGGSDRLAGKKIQEKMQSVYPDAQTYIFEEAGHSAMITHNREWAEVIGRFLRTSSSADRTN